MDENSTKVLDFSIFLRYTAQRKKKKNCKYRRQFCKSVQPFHAKEVCPTFWDRPPSELLFSPGFFFDYSDAILRNKSILLNQDGYFDKKQVNGFFNIVWKALTIMPTRIAEIIVPSLTPYIFPLKNNNDRQTANNTQRTSNAIFI